MKLYIIIGLALISHHCFAQKTIQLGRPIKMDSSLKVVYTNHEKDANYPAVFIYVNNTLVHIDKISNVDPMSVEDLNIKNGEILIDSIRYNGQIHIKIKKDYNLKLISLNELKAKYTNLKNAPVIFMIDGEIINADYDKYKVDENYLLRIIIDKIENTKEKINLGLIKLLTKSPANIEKVNEIRIR